MAILNPIRVQLLLSSTEFCVKFWSKVERCSHEEWCPYCCWPWQGRICNGYGKCYLYKDPVSKESIAPPAHCIAWAVGNGRSLPPGLWGLHHCDNPPCCNPWHIFPGTHRDNVNDRQRKGRSATGVRNGKTTRPERTPRGEHNGNAKLTAEQVTTLRRLATSGQYTEMELASVYGVAWTTIAMAVRGETWTHVPGAVLPHWRAAAHWGEHNAKAKLTAAAVQEIRHLMQQGAATIPTLAALYGVHRHTIQDVVQRRTWKHLP